MNSGMFQKAHCEWKDGRVEVIASILPSFHSSKVSSHFPGDLKHAQFYTEFTSGLKDCAIAPFNYAVSLDNICLKRVSFVRAESL